MFCVGVGRIRVVDKNTTTKNGSKFKALFIGD